MKTPARFKTVDGLVHLQVQRPDQKRFSPYSWCGEMLNYLIPTVDDAPTCLWCAASVWQHQ